MTFEYKAELLGWHDLQDGRLDQYGRDGWDVISIVSHHKQDYPSSTYYQIVLKRCAPELQA